MNLDQLFIKSSNNNAISIDVLQFIHTNITRICEFGINICINKLTDSMLSDPNVLALLRSKYISDLPALVVFNSTKPIVITGNNNIKNYYNQMLLKNSAEKQTIPKAPMMVPKDTELSLEKYINDAMYSGDQDRNMTDDMEGGSLDNDLNKFRARNVTMPSHPGKRPKPAMRPSIPLSEDNEQEVIPKPPPKQKTDDIDNNYIRNTLHGEVDPEYEMMMEKMGN